MDAYPGHRGGVSALKGTGDRAGNQSGAGNPRGREKPTVEG